MRSTSGLLVALLTAAGMLPVGNAYGADPAINPATGAPAEWGQPMMDGKPIGMALIDRAESGSGNNADTYVWDAQAWYGTDRNKLWLKSEGEGDRGSSPEDAELQALYSRLLSPFFVWQAGVRHDFAPDAERNFVVLGLQGLGPYMYELDSALFISEDGDISARVEAEYDLLLTQRLILQPRFEVNAALSSVPEVAVGSGLNSSELGLRLRYEVRRKFAPYIGVSWTKLYGETADMREAGSSGASNLSIVAGLRAWF